MRKTVIFLLALISLVVLSIRFGSDVFDRVFHRSERAGIRVEANVDSTVSIDDKQAGQTPYQSDEATPGEHKISLKSDSGTWQGYATFNPGTLTVVNRDISTQQASASGEVISLEKGSGLTVLSQPTGATVEVDGQAIGQTPLSVPSLSAGEHLFLVSHDDFLKRSIRAVVTAGYKLNLDVDLAVDQSQVPVVQAIPTPSPGANVEVLETPTGFLRVRDQPSTGGNEIFRVAPGDTLSLLGEQTGWFKVKLPNNQTGYISSDYAKKI